MEESRAQLQAYIKQQLASGITADEIASHLQTINWPDAEIQYAFQSVQAAMAPTLYATSPQPQLPTQPLEHQQPVAETVQTTASSPIVHPQAMGVRRGRIKIGWLLLKQALTLLKGNRYLLRYLVMTGVWIVGITIVFIGAYLILWLVILKSQTPNSTAGIISYVLAFLDYLFIYFFINLYAAGLAANVLDIFQGVKKPYHAYMRIAWSKARPLFVFSIFSATVGMFLQFVVERIRYIGWILMWLLGTAWSLGTMFVIPIIVTDEHPGGYRSLKQSVKFFKATWGEDITARVSVNLPLFLINLALACSFLVIFILAGPALGFFGLLSICIIYWIAVITLAIIGSFANSLLNVALFYYAAYNKIPPAFSVELLDQVFIKRKHRFFKKAKA